MVVSSGNMRRTFFKLVVAWMVGRVAVQAKQVVVGNQMGWTDYDVKSLKPPNYEAWATAQKVVVGDQLVFKYARGRHNVYLLPNKVAYESCDFSEAELLDAGGSGIHVWNATHAATYYFGCNKEVEEEGNHCGSGQKVGVAVRLAMPPSRPPELPILGAKPPAASSALTPPQDSGTDKLWALRFPPVLVFLSVLIILSKL